MRIRRVLLALLLALFVLAPTFPLLAEGQKTVHVKPYTKKDGTHVKGHDRKAPQPRATKPATAAKPKKESSVTTPPLSVARDEHGRIQRSDAARHAFARKTGYPNGRPGYVIDHIVPLACGGADAPSNMQWQTIAQAKAKDKVERQGC